MVLKLSTKNENRLGDTEYHLGSEHLRFNHLFSYRLSIYGAELSDFIFFLRFQNLSQGINVCLASKRVELGFWGEWTFTWRDVGVFSEAAFFSSHKGEFWLSNNRGRFHLSD